MWAHKNAHLTQFTQKRTVSLRFFLKLLGKTVYRKGALLPMKIHEVDDYRTTSSGKTEKKYSYFAAGVAVKRYLDKP